MNLRHQVSAAAHELLRHANPLSADQMAELARIATSRRPTTAIEIGCGAGSFSIALASASPASVRAIDLNPVFLDRARKARGKSALAGKIEFLERPLLEDEAGQFDLVVCIGSSGAIGTPREAIHRCERLMSAAGTLVFADLVWARKPPMEFLSFLGVDESCCWPRAEAAGAFGQCGLVIQNQLEASKESWRGYENAVLAGRVRFADTLDPEVGAAVREHARSWFAMYELHGHSCLGFVAYVAQRDRLRGRFSGAVGSLTP